MQIRPYTLYRRFCSENRNGFISGIFALGRGIFYFIQIALKTAFPVLRRGALLHGLGWQEAYFVGGCKKIDGWQLTVKVSALPTVLKLLRFCRHFKPFLWKNAAFAPEIRSTNDILNGRSRSTTVNCKLSTVNSICFCDIVTKKISAVRKTKNKARPKPSFVRCGASPL